MTAPVLVLGSGTRAFLTVVRSLGRRGLCVHAGMAEPHSPAGRSRYIHRLHRLTPYAESPEAWKNELTFLLDRHHYALVIPCDDPSLVPLHVHRSHFARFPAIHLMPPQAFNAAFDKQESHTLAGEANVRVAEQIRVRSLEEGRTAIEALGVPAVLKPLRSYSIENLRRKNRVRVIRSAAELPLYLPDMLAQDGALFESYFKGRGAGVEVLAHRGRILTAFQHRRLHEPRDGGGSSYRVSVPVHLQLRQAAEAIIARLDYTGVAMLEFLLNEDSGDWVFVEINARFWGSLPLAVACGADFPYFLYQLLVEGNQTFPQRYRTGIRCRNLLRDLAWLRECGNAKGKTARLARTALELTKTAADALQYGESSDTFAFDDLRPAFAEVTQAAHSMWSKAQARSAVLARRLPWLRRWNAARARDVLRRARCVLFVCKGNICRSPFAERYARRHPNVSARVLSAGYLPSPGRSSPPPAIRTARRLGIELADHRSRVLSPEMLQQADAIVVFDRSNYEHVRAHYPSTSDRLFLAGDLDVGAPLEIADPLGASEAVFESTYREISRSIDALWGKGPVAQTKASGDASEWPPPPATHSTRCDAVPARAG